ncbi:hypothetical protein B0H13DRAFT_2336577 [Mycena leptocephala]|nr:hypothetical protein B0H13DRAFT_2336577 [Mycena leptocephala]
MRTKLAGPSPGAAYINYSPTPTPATRHVRTLTPIHQPRTAPKQAAHELVPHDSDLHGEVHARPTRKVVLAVFPLVGPTCIIPPQHSLPHARHDSSSCGLMYSYPSTNTLLCEAGASNLKRSGIGMKTRTRLTWTA